MGLLQDIQTAAIDGETDLATILRQCKLLAARLNLKPLEDWLLWESGGYPNDVPVPAYRIWSLNLKGHFSGPFGSGLRFAPVPLVSVPEPHRRFYEAFECRQSVSGLESLLAAGASELHVGTGDLNRVLGSKVYLRMNCLQVWAEFGAGNVVEVLNTVRNKILDFALATGKDYPQAGEPDGQPTTTIDKSQITQIFQTTVHGGGTATFVGAAPNSSVAGVVVPGNLESLRANLTHRGVPDTEVNALADAVKADGQHASEQGIGPKVSAWVGRMAMMGAEGTLKAGGGLAIKAITEALSHYYGLKL